MDKDNKSLHDLYGGALRVKLPNTFTNASEMRQIPDHQEVFVDTRTDSSWIVEILEQAESSDPVKYELCICGIV